MRKIKPRPVTLERIDRAMDRLAQIILDHGQEGLQYLVIYERLEQEREIVLEQEGQLNKLRERLKQSKARMAAEF
ncbi:hypothetical protein ACI0FM_08485 [Paenochrobactrum sp. BZR 588]|uniref:hypothetical protein n=1 Tax=unclassified Paenochrobactrum TaxID=2639760 RepID=UPI003851F10F